MAEAVTSPTIPLPVDDSKLFDDLERESKEFDKDAEIARILSTFRLNSYAVLDLLPGVPAPDIQRTYRQKSLLIHPDKCSNPAAPDAFDRLKKAQSALLDDGERGKLDEAIADARMLVMREHGWTVDAEELREERFLRELWPDKAKHVLMDNEVRRRKQLRAQMQEEGRAQRKEEEDLAERKRKREDEVRWEGTREARIGSWRDFKQGAKSEKKMVAEGSDAPPLEKKKKKKEKVKVLG